MARRNLTKRFISQPKTWGGMNLDYQDDDVLEFSSEKYEGSLFPADGYFAFQKLVGPNFISSAEAAKWLCSKGILYGELMAPNVDDDADMAGWAAIVLPESFPHWLRKPNPTRNLANDKVYAVHFNTVAYSDMDGSDEHYVIDSIYTTKELAQKRIDKLETDEESFYERNYKILEIDLDPTDAGYGLDFDGSMRFSNGSFYRVV
jgi:hypothetical protein